MPYQFQTVDVSVFDYHTAIASLESPDFLQDDVRFLADEDKYRATYQAGKDIVKPHFKMRPLRWRMLAHHHFWKYYQSISPGAVPDFWKLQMPFICKPVNPAPKLVTGNPNIEGRVRAMIFLSAIGWSTNVDLRLTGAIKPTQLRDFVQKLTTGVPVFNLDGEQKSLTDIFKHFSEQIIEDIYKPAFVDRLRIKRHLIISLSEFTGDLNSYRSQGSDLNQMPAADRAMLHSILKGQSIGIPEVVKLEKEGGFLRTDFHDPDFALTYFDYGTLIFLQRAARQGTALWKRKRKALECHTSNIRNYFLMTLCLRRFHTDTKSYAGKKERVGLLRNYIETVLTDLPSQYDNVLAQEFYKNYGPIKSLQAGKP